MPTTFVPWPRLAVRPMLNLRKDMAAPGTIYRWTTAYSVNIEILDKQHERLFDTVNELNRALRSGSGGAAVELILVRLVDYVHEHFTAEELLMDYHGFPGLAAHKAEHAMFRKKIDAFLDGHNAGKTGVPVDLMLFMRTWLKDHVLTVDKRYSEFLNARGVR